MILIGMRGSDHALGAEIRSIRDLTPAEEATLEVMPSFWAWVGDYQELQHADTRYKRLAVPPAVGSPVTQAAMTEIVQAFKTYVIEFCSFLDRSRRALSAESQAYPDALSEFNAACRSLHSQSLMYQLAGPLRNEATHRTKIAVGRWARCSLRNSAMTPNDVPLSAR